MHHIRPGRLIPYLMSFGYSTEGDMLAVWWLSCALHKVTYMYTCVPNIMLHNAPHSVVIYGRYLSCSKFPVFGFFFRPTFTYVWTLCFITFYMICIKTCWWITLSYFMLTWFLLSNYYSQTLTTLWLDANLSLTGCLCPTCWCFEAGHKGSEKEH